MPHEETSQVFHTCTPQNQRSAILSCLEYPLTPQTQLMVDQSGPCRPETAAEVDPGELHFHSL